MFPSSLSAGKRAGECRKIFENKILNCFEIIEVEERACALSKVVVKVSFTTDIEPKEATLVFGCVYESNSDRVGVVQRFRLAGHKSSIHSEQHGFRSFSVNC